MEVCGDVGGNFCHLEPDRESKLGEGGEGEPLQVAGNNFVSLDKEARVKLSENVLSC